MLVARQNVIQVPHLRTYRAEALQLIRRGAQKFKMGFSTVQLSMLYYDIVVKPSQSLQNWTLNALTCLVLACKFQERDDYVPLIEDMIKSLVSAAQLAPSARLTARSNQAITYEQVTKTEIEYI